MLDCFEVFGEKRFLNEERLVRFERLCELLGHGLVYTPVEVKTRVDA